MRWSGREDWLLLSLGLPIRELAARLQRSENAVRLRMRRIGIRSRQTWSVAALAARGGVDRQRIARIGRALGQTWRSNGKRGRSARFAIDEEQASAILAALEAELASWSLDHARCRRCGTSGRAAPERHHGRGLCKACFWRRETALAIAMD